MNYLKMYESFGTKKKCVVIHGLGGGINNDRIDVLREFGYECVYPVIIYYICN